jgi:hypothetical protein
VRVNTDEEWKGAADFSPLGPTFELPKGILSGAGISAVIGEDQIAVFHNGIDGDDGAFHQVNPSHPDKGIEAWTGPPPRLPRGGIAAATITLHPQKFITLKCAPTPGHFVVGRMSEPIGMATGKPLLIKQLPEDVQKKPAKAAKSLGDVGSAGSGFRG